MRTRIGVEARLYGPGSIGQGGAAGIPGVLAFLIAELMPGRINSREERLVWAHVPGLWSVVIDEQFLVPVCLPSSLKEPHSTLLCLLFLTF